MISTANASAAGTLSRSDAGSARRVVVWLAALAAAVILASSLAFVVHRVTSSDTVPPATLTQQQSTPQQRVADPGKRLIQINDEPGTDAAPAAPPAPSQWRTKRLIGLNS